MNIRDNETKLVIADSNKQEADLLGNDTENEKLRLQLIKIQNDYEINKRKIEEAERHNRETEKKAISRTK